MKTPRVVILFLGTILWGISSAAAQQTADEYFHISFRQSFRGLYADAIDSLNNAQMLRPRDAKIVFAKGYLHVRYKDWEKAVKEIGRAIELDPTEGSFYYYLAYANIYLGQIKKGAENYATAQELGFTETPSKGDLVGKLLTGYKKKNRSVTYEPYYYETNKSVTIAVNGNPRGNKKVVTEKIMQLEEREYGQGREMFTAVDVDFLRWESNHAEFWESWTIESPSGFVEYWIHSNTRPPVGHPYQVEITLYEEPPD